MLLNFSSNLWWYRCNLLVLAFVSKWYSIHQLGNSSWWNPYKLIIPINVQINIQKMSRKKNYLLQKIPRSYNHNFRIIYLSSSWSSSSLLIDRERCIQNQKKFFRGWCIGRPWVSCSWLRLPVEGQLNRIGRDYKDDDFFLLFEVKRLILVLFIRMQLELHDD